VGQGCVEAGDGSLRQHQPVLQVATVGFKDVTAGKTAQISSPAISEARQELNQQLLLTKIGI
jgi:hypothetical protein